MLYRIIIPARVRAALPRFDAAAEIRQELALAMLQDTAAAARMTRQVYEVLVVTPDAEVDGCLDVADVRVVAAPAADTLAEFLAPIVMEEDVSWVRKPTAILMGDLPALRPEELGRALEAAVSANVLRDLGNDQPTLVVNHRGCPDLALLTLRSRRRLARSPAIHDWGLHADVDTVEGLSIARHLGVGPATSTLLQTSRVSELLNRAVLAGGLAS